MINRFEFDTITDRDTRCIAASFYAIANVLDREIGDTQNKQAALERLLLARDTAIDAVAREISL